MARNFASRHEPTRANAANLRYGNANMVNDRDPPSDSFRRDSSTDLARELAPVLNQQAEIIRSEARERDRRNKERSRHSAEQVRAMRELTDRLSRVEDRVSELYTRDALDVGALNGLEKDHREMKQDFLLDIKELKATNKELQLTNQMLLDERNKTQGGINMLKVMIPAVGAVTAVVTWALQHIK